MFTLVDPGYDADSEGGDSWNTESDASDSDGDSCDVLYILRPPP